MQGETELEEIYHYVVADGPAGPGLAYQHVYGTADRPIEVLTTVATGDVVLVPHGWHGPAMAAPGYDLYYLNVMAGPGERAWRAPDDPSHAWVARDVGGRKRSIRGCRSGDGRLTAGPAGADRPIAAGAGPATIERPSRRTTKGSHPMGFPRPTASPRT